MLPQSHVKDPGHSAKSASGSLPLSKHTPYVCDFAWSDIVHGCMVYTERAETAVVLCGTSHASAVSTPVRWVFKTSYKKLVTHVESHASAASLLDSGESRYIKAINNSNYFINFRMLCTLVYHLFV